MTPVAQLLDQIRHAQNPPEAVATHAFAGLSAAQQKQYERQGWTVYRGKVREMLARDAEVLMIHSDRLSAFDRFVALVPYKGVILSAISQWWLEKARTVVPTHYLGCPHERVLRVKNSKPFKVEVVVRGYLAGSIMRAYKEGAREYCGAPLPNGLKPYQQLPEPIITPTTKAPAFEHDENISSARVVSSGICSQAEWHSICDFALKVFALGQQVYRDAGWLLADTKYEFGRGPDGVIQLIDELHTPDSSRFWVAESYAANLAKDIPPEMLDKEIVRQYLLSQNFSGHGDVPKVPVDLLLRLADIYLRVAETLLGKPLFSVGPLETLPELSHVTSSS